VPADFQAFSYVFPGRKTRIELTMIEALEKSMAPAANGSKHAADGQRNPHRIEKGPE
jgi:hypothetical protein